MWIESGKYQVKESKRKQTVSAAIEGDNTASDPSYSMDNEDEVQNKKAKYDYSNIDLDISEIEDDIPHRFRHIRSGLRNVRPEVYTVMHKLKSQYHLSQRQREAAIVEVGNYLFGRNWKFYNEENVSDSNTLPAGSNLRRTEPYLEAMALSAIVEEVMNGSKASVMQMMDQQ